MCILPLIWFQVSAFRSWPWFLVGSIVCSLNQLLSFMFMLTRLVRDALAYVYAEGGRVHVQRWQKFHQMNFVREETISRNCWKPLAPALPESVEELWECLSQKPLQLPLVDTEAGVNDLGLVQVYTLGAELTLEVFSSWALCTDDITQSNEATNSAEFFRRFHRKLAIIYNLFQPSCSGRLCLNRLVDIQ